MKTINLLPKVKQEELRYEAIAHGVLTVLWLSVVSFTVVFAVQFGAKLYLEYTASTIKEDIARLTAEVNKQNNAKVKDQITAINNVVSDYKTLTDTAPQWSKLIKAFVPLIPQGVQIGSLSVSTTDNKVLISGRSPTREAVIQLYNNILNDTEHFSGIDYPLENVSKPTDVNFHFTFSVQNSVLH